MANFGEDIAYWYLRLNGFIPLTNLVIHSTEHAAAAAADTDLLAVRFPWSQEIIRDTHVTVDTTRFEQWGIDLANLTVCLVVEVKSGINPTSSNELHRRSFSRERLQYGLDRVGIVPQETRTDVINRLSNGEAMVRLNELNIVIGKLLIANAGRELDNTSFCRLSFADAVGFIRDRVRAHRQAKIQDRVYFPHSLIQYLIWEEESGHLATPAT